MGKLAQHSKASCSVPEVNGAVAQGEFTSLLREICAPGTVPHAGSGAAGREVRREGTDLSPVGRGERNATAGSSPAGVSEVGTE
jgi:hypothetical protein